MVTVYAIKSVGHAYIYVGMTKNLQRRMGEHNAGRTRSNRSYAPFILIYQEFHPDWGTARRREKYFKSAAGKRWLRRLLSEEEE